jgi:hypothetical protein
MVLAAGTLIAAASAGPALAADTLVVPAGTGPGIIDDTRDWDGLDWDYGDDPYFGDPYLDDDGLGGGHFDYDPRDDGLFDFNDSRRFEGRVIARNGLALHNRPDRDSRITRIAPYRERVNIYCKTWGERVDGNSTWYLISDGVWSWAPAQRISISGPSPRRC